MRDIKPTLTYRPGLVEKDIEIEAAGPPPGFAGSSKPLFHGTQYIPDGLRRQRGPQVSNGVHVRKLLGRTTDGACPTQSADGLQLQTLLLRQTLQSSPENIFCIFDIRTEPHRDQSGRGRERRLFCGRCHVTCECSGDVQHRRLKETTAVR